MNKVLCNIKEVLICLVENVSFASESIKKGRFQMIKLTLSASNRLPWYEVPCGVSTLTVYKKYATADGLFDNIVCEK